VGNQLALRVGDRGFAEREGRRLVQHAGAGRQGPKARAHEARLHLHRDHTAGLRHAIARAAGSVGHGHVEQRHDHASVHHAEGVELVLTGRQADFGLAVGKLAQLEAQRLDKRNGDGKLHRSERFFVRADPLNVLQLGTTAKPAVRRKIERSFDSMQRMRTPLVPEATRGRDSPTRSRARRL
jgi:hypothetical protein